MKEKTFRRLAAAILIIGTLATAGHLIYITQAYQHCSIICFIADEQW